MDVTRYLAGSEENSETTVRERFAPAFVPQSNGMGDLFVHEQQKPWTTKDTKDHEGLRHGLFNGNSDWESRWL